MNDSGYVMLSQKLDRETTEFYELSIKATDKAGEQSGFLSVKYSRKY